MMNRDVRKKKPLLVALAVVMAGGGAVAASTSADGVTDYDGAKGYDTYSFASVGDIGQNHDGTKAANMLTGVARSGVDQFVMNGDLLYTDPAVYSEQRWCDNVNAKIPNTMPKSIISGNHESGAMVQKNGLIDNFIKPGCLPNTLPITTAYATKTTAPNPTNYAKEYFVDRGKQSSNGKPLVRMIFTSPGLNFTNGGKFDYTKGSERYNRLASWIDGARAEGIKWVVVVNHQNYVSVGSHVDEVGPDYYNLLASKKVDLNLNGHDHTNQRTKQLALSASCPSIPAVVPDTDCIVNDATNGHYTKDKGMFTVIAGNGGKSFHSAKPVDPDAPYFAKYMTDAYQTSGFEKIVITPTSLRGSFVPTDGTYTDSFVIDSAASPASTSQTTRAFAATADTYVDSATPTTNYGKATRLGVDYAPSLKRTYLRFDTSGLTGKTIKSAKLKFYVKDASVSTVNVVKTIGTWSETGTTWNNRPGTTSSFIPLTNLKTGWNEVSIPVGDVPLSGSLNYGIHPKDSTSTDGLDVASREDAPYAPSLVVTTN